MSAIVLAAIAEHGVSRFVGMRTKGVEVALTINDIGVSLEKAMERMDEHLEYAHSQGIKEGREDAKQEISDRLHNLIFVDEEENH